MQVDRVEIPSMPADGSSPHLPPELSAMIIDHLHDDFPTLKTCSIVCGSWLPVTRYHLFNSTEVECEYGSWDHLIEFLANATPSVADSIREICLTSGLMARDPDNEPHFGVVRSYHLIYLLDHLKHLHTISLERVHWRCGIEVENERFLSGWPPVPRSLDTLKLDDVLTLEEGDSTYSGSPLSAKKIGLMQLFSSIRHLDILWAPAEVLSLNPAAIPGAMVHAWSLRDCETPSDLHRSLSEMGSLRCLESLSIDVQNPLPSLEEAEQRFEIIYDNSATLTSLDIDYLGTPARSLPPGTDDREAAVWNRLRLTERQFPLLESLGFEIELNPGDPFLFQLYNLVYPTEVERKDPTLWPYIISLSQREPPLVKSLTVTHEVLINYGLGPRRRYDKDALQEAFVVDIFNLVDWKSVISALNGWHSLEEVCVHVKVCIYGRYLRYGNGRKVEDALRRWLKGLSPSIRLVLQHDPPNWI